MTNFVIISVQQQQPFNSLCSGTTRVGRYQKKHSAFCLSKMAFWQFAACVTDINAWLSACRLQLNAAKTQLLWLGSCQLVDRVNCHDVLVLGTRIAISDTASDLGIIIDRELSLTAHVTAVCHSGYNQLRQLRPVVRSLFVNATKTLVQAFISCRLD